MAWRCGEGDKGRVPCCVALCGAVWRCVEGDEGRVPCCVALCGAVSCCIVLCGAVWCCIVLYRAVWRCMVLCGVVCDAVSCCVVVCVECIKYTVGVACMGVVGMGDSSWHKVRREERGRKEGTGHSQ